MKIMSLILFAACLKVHALDYTYSTNYFSTSDQVTNIYIGTNGPDATKDTVQIAWNKVNHNFATLQQRGFDLNTAFTNYTATNLAGTIKFYSTNSTLTAATSLKIYFPPFPDAGTNYIAIPPGEFIGATTTDKQSNNFTMTFTAVTFTNHILENPIFHK